MGSVVQGNNHGLYLEALFVEGTVASGCHFEQHRSTLAASVVGATMCNNNMWCNNVQQYVVRNHADNLCWIFLLLLVLVCGSGIHVNYHICTMRRYGSDKDMAVNIPAMLPYNYGFSNLLGDHIYITVEYSVVRIIHHPIMT